MLGRVMKVSAIVADAVASSASTSLIGLIGVLAVDDDAIGGVAGPSWILPGAVSWVSSITTDGMETADAADVRRASFFGDPCETRGGSAKSHTPKLA